jgi:hypothetical protein
MLDVKKNVVKSSQEVKDSLQRSSKVRQWTQKKITPIGKTYKQNLLEIASIRIIELTQFLKLLVDDPKLKDEQILHM